MTDTSQLQPFKRDIAERVAIETHSEIVRWLGDRDTTTRRLIEELLAKEEEHADDLASLLEKVPAGQHT